MSRGFQIVVAVILIAAFCVVGVALALGFRWRADSRTPETWEIPYGLRGLIVVRYERSTCSALPIRGGRLIYAVPSSGEFCTSSSFPQGVATDEYFWVDETHRLPLVVPDEVDKLSYEGSTKQLFLFVGTPQEQRDALDRIRPLRRQTGSYEGLRALGSGLAPSTRRFLRTVMPRTGRGR